MFRPAHRKDGRHAENTTSFLRSGGVPLRRYQFLSAGNMVPGMNVKLLDLQAQYLPIRNEIRRAIDEVCDAQALILGPAVERFEKNLAAYCQAKHAIGVSSGTDALLCSLMARGIKSGDGG